MDDFSHPHLSFLAVNSFSFFTKNNHPLHSARNFFHNKTFFFLIIFLIFDVEIILFLPIIFSLREIITHCLFKVLYNSTIKLSEKTH